MNVDDPSIELPGMLMDLIDGPGPLRSAHGRGKQGQRENRRRERIHAGFLMMKRRRT